MDHGSDIMKQDKVPNEIKTERIQIKQDNLQQLERVPGSMHTARQYGYVTPGPLFLMGTVALYRICSTGLR